MTQFLDFVPIALFAAVFFVAGIYWATATLMIAVTVQVLVYLLIRKPLSRELHLTFWASLIFGGLTLVFHNPTFLQWKPTIVYWVMAGSLVVSGYVGRANLLKRLLGEHLTLVDQAWSRINAGWAVGLFFAGVLNLVVAYNFSMKVWVSYKLFGSFALTFLYILLTAAYLSYKGFLQTEDQQDGGGDGDGNDHSLEINEKS